MKSFCIHIIDAPNSLEKREQYLAAHIAHLKPIKESGRMHVAGPLVNANNEPIGSLIVADFTDEQAVKQWLADEPYQKAGVYESVSIHPYLDALDAIR